jgi:hypothetical protein
VTEARAISASGAVFQSTIDPAAGTSNRLVVDGTTTLTSGAAMNVTKVDSGKLKLGDSFTMLTATGGVTDQRVRLDLRFTF